MRAVAVVVEKGRLLVIRRVRDGNEYWVLPGGSIEPGESPEQACVRELREETGLHGIVLQRIGVTDDAEYFHVQAGGVPHLGGPEVERQSAGNVYEPMWSSPERMLSALVPEGARDAVRHVLG